MKAKPLDQKKQNQDRKERKKEKKEGRKEGRKKERSNLLLKNERKASFS